MVDKNKHKIQRESDTDLQRLRTGNGSQFDYADEKYAGHDSGHACQLGLE
ncbi:MAG: hypothetical protein Q4F24_03520 [Eubacteriales bacterium]|nr:hypothetical protein [Eubacteriales bacterium]